MKKIMHNFKICSALKLFILPKKQYANRLTMCQSIDNMPIKVTMCQSIGAFEEKMVCCETKSITKTTIIIIAVFYLIM